MMVSSTLRDISSGNNARSSKPSKSRCLSITEMVLAALPSIIFGVFTVVFAVQQDKTARENRQQDQRQEDEQNIRSSFEKYIDDISALVLSRKFNRSNPEHLLHIRVKTLSVLRRVDASRKRDIILFLYESRLLRSNLPSKQRLNLIGGDLSNVHFIGTWGALLQLSYIDLSNVYAPNVAFHWCNLNSAVFDNAFMPNGKISNSSIYKTRFNRIYAPDLMLGDIFFHGTSFTGAMVHRMNFIGAINTYEIVDFSNADLLDSFKPGRSTLDVSMHLHVFMNLCNSRLSDGSFAVINDSNLIIDGGAEETVCFQ